MATLPKCEGCRKNFTPLPSGAGEATPTLLRCGHTFCKHCLLKWVSGKEKLLCPKCEVITYCHNGKDGVQQLWPNIYFTGVMACGSRLDTFSHYFENIDCESGVKRPQKDETFGPKCSECIKADAACRCLQCRVNMCERCFSSVHSYSRLLQQHQSVSLRPSLTNTECKRHRRLLEFFCEEHKCAICPECVISAEHKSHNVVRMVSKYEALKPQLRACQGMVNCALSHSTSVKSQVEAELHKVKNAASQQAQLVNRYFLDLISKLQANFLGVIKELHDCAEIASSELFTIMEEIVAKELVIKEAYDDTDLILSDDAKSQVVVDPDELLRVMQACTSLPCNLITLKETIDNSEEKEYFGEFEFQFNPNPEIIKMQQKFGRMEIKTCLVRKLKTLAECPDILVNADQKEHHHEKKPAKIRHIQEPYSKSQELVNVTYMDNPTAFRVQRFSDKSHIEGIDRCLKVFRSRKPLVDELFRTISAGELCAAFYEPSRCWYRACVLRKVSSGDNANDFANDACDSNYFDNRLDNDTIGPNDVVEVDYVDYGDSSKTRVSRLRRLPETLKVIPELGISCSLNNICPDEGESWSAECVNYFSKVISDRPLLMTTVRREKGVRVVDLHRPAADEIDADVPMSIRDALVFLGFARFQFTAPAPTLAQRPAVKKFLTPSPFAAGSLVSVVIANLQSPEKFSVQLTDSNREYFAKLMQKIQVWVTKHTSGKNAPAISNAVHNIQIICPNEGMVCLARFSQDGLWYRAQITNVNSDQTVKVEYVDFGDMEVVHFLELLKIPEQFMRLPVQAITCRIHGVGSLPDEDSFSDVCCKRFAELCSHTELIMDVKLVKDRIYYVDLFDSTDEDPSIVSVADRLYREGLLKFESSEKMQGMRSVEDAIDSHTGPEENGHSNKPSSKLKDSCRKQKARVTQVTSPDLFHLQTEAQMSELNKMMLQLQKAVKDMQREAGDAVGPENWQEGAMCVVWSSSEKRWCRGVVESVEEEARRVVLIDFGWQEMIPSRCLLNLPEQFEVAGGFVTKCSLGSVKPAGGSDKWTSTAVDRFKELISGEECLLQLLTENEEPLENLPVDIWISEEQQGNVTLESTNCLKVSRMLELEGLALPVRKGFRRVPKIGKTESRSKQTENVIVTESVGKRSSYDALNAVDGISDMVASGSNGKSYSSWQGRLGAEAPCYGRSSSETNRIVTAGQAPLVPAISYSGVNALSVEERIPCFVTHICDHSTFLLRKRPVDCGDEFDAVLEEIYECNVMMKQVQDLERCRISELADSDMVVGKPCLCLFIADRQWHRGVILSIDQLPEAVQVQYVDFGTIENIPLNRLRQIPEPLVHSPLQAYMCRLEGVTASGCSGEVKLEFASILQGKELVAEIRAVCPAPPGREHYRDMYVVRLFFVNEDGELEVVPEVVEVDVQL